MYYIENGVTSIDPALMERYLKKRANKIYPILYEVTGKKAVALLDDVMSELDINRQNYILNHIKDWQVFITCCDKENFNSLKEGKIFEVKNGEILI